MKFLADMGIPPRITEELRQNNHDAIHLREENLFHLLDSEILEKARKESRVLLTHDLDFGELLAASGGNLPSVIVFRLQDMRPSNVSRHLMSIIKQQNEALTNGVIITVTEKKIRIRTLPI